MPRKGDLSAIKPSVFRPDSPLHRRQIAEAVNKLVEELVGPLRLDTYTQTTPSDTRPAASAYEGYLIYTTDTKKVQVSDGTAWINL